MSPIEDDAPPFGIEAREDEGAGIARVFVDGEWQGDADEARALLAALDDQWPEGRRVDTVVLFSKFLLFRWPDGLKRWDIGDNLDPPPAVIGRLLDEGEKCVRSVFSPAVRRRLRDRARFLTVGASTYYFRDSYYDPHAELVFALDLESGRAWRTGKSYPNPRQEHGLVRVADLGSHFIEVGGRETMLLSCHDLNFFSPRSYHNARGWRKASIERFRALARERGPELLLWHPHRSDTPRTWIPGLGGLRKLLPGAGYAGAGIYYNDGQPPRASFESVRKHTKNLPTIDLIATPLSRESR